MISDPLARALRAAGLVWHPESGDRFRIEAELLTDVVFTLSDMTIEAHRYESGTVLGFNGTTEWALDSVDLDDALWLPLLLEKKRFRGRFLFDGDRMVSHEIAVL